MNMYIPEGYRIANSTTPEGYKIANTIEGLKDCSEVIIKNMSTGEEFQAILKAVK